MPTAIPTSAPRESKLNDPPPWWEKVKAWANEHIVQPVKNTFTTVKNAVINTSAAIQNRYEQAKKLAASAVSKALLSVWDMINPNARGEDLLEVSKDEILRSPEIALWKTYLAAAINVQRDGINFGGYESGKGPAQLSQQQLDMEYGEPYGCKEIPSENKRECRGYGLGLKDKNPYDPHVAVEGMSRRIEQVLRHAENQAERKHVTLDATDRFIIIALSQNGPGFDNDDISNLLRNHILDGRINWKDYFRKEHDSWPEEKAKKPWWEQIGLEVWEVIKTGNGGKDFNTEFQLELYYQELLALERQGYPFPEGLDIQRIEDLMNTSEQAKREGK